jgi:hypothetical protein
MKGRVAAVVLSLLCCAVGSLVGCERGGEKYETLKGANERVAALDRDNQSLREELKRKDAELAALKSSASRDFDERVVKLKELHAGEVAGLRETVSELRLKQSQLQSQNLVLQEIVGQRDRAAWFVRTRVELLLVAAGVCTAAFLTVACYVGSRLYAARNLMNQLLVRRVHAGALVEGTR